MCRSWVCSEGIYKGTCGNKGGDKLNTAYHQSTNAASGSQAGMDGYSTIVDFLTALKRGKQQAKGQ